MGLQGCQLRRSSWPRSGSRLDAGLFFIAYTRDPDRHFIPLQANLARSDALNEYIQHTGSAIFAVPRGTSEGRYIGQSLVEG